MANPLVAQGFLNRVKAGVSVTDISALNISASYLAKEGVSMRPDGPATDMIDTMVGRVGSQVPYMPVTVTIAMLKTQGLAASYQSRFSTDTSLGEVVVTPDASTMDNFTLLNCYLLGFNEMRFNGGEVGYLITIGGYLVVNDNMWS